MVATDGRENKYPPLLPSVCCEEEVDGCVVQLALTFEIRVDHAPSGQSAVGKAPQLGINLLSIMLSIA